MEPGDGAGGGGPVAETESDADARGDVGTAKGAVLTRGCEVLATEAAAGTARVAAATGAVAAAVGVVVVVVAAAVGVLAGEAGEVGNVVTLARAALVMIAADMSTATTAGTADFEPVDRLPVVVCGICVGVVGGGAVCSVAVCVAAGLTPAVGKPNTALTEIGMEPACARVAVGTANDDDVAAECDTSTTDSEIGRDASELDTGTEPGDSGSFHSLWSASATGVSVNVSGGGGAAALRWLALKKPSHEARRPAESAATNGVSFQHDTTPQHADL